MAAIVYTTQTAQRPQAARQGIVRAGGKPPPKTVGQLWPRGAKYA